MPIIAKFYGLIIKMYFQQAEHNPPHFHVIYGEYVGVFDIQTLKMIEGICPVKLRRWLKSGRKFINKLY